MTEQEARTKWCPFASSRVITYQELERITHNIGYAIPAGSRPDVLCLGCECMAWRWETPIEPPADASLRATRHGRCGLVG